MSTTTSSSNSLHSLSINTNPCSMGAIGTPSTHTSTSASTSPTFNALKGTSGSTSASLTTSAPFSALNGLLVNTSPLFESLSFMSQCGNDILNNNFLNMNNNLDFAAFNSRSSNCSQSSKDDSSNLLTSSSSSSSPPPPAPQMNHTQQTSDTNNNLQNTTSTNKCRLCKELMSNPKVLTECFHSFCHNCIERLAYTNTSGTHIKITCPICSQDTQICAEAGLTSLITDYSLLNLVLGTPSSSTTESARCQGCKSIDSSAVAKCYDCSNYLCHNCVVAHQYMLCFDGHHVVNLSSSSSSKESDSASSSSSSESTTPTTLNLNNSSLHTGATGATDRSLYCTQHKNELLKYYCVTCNVPICHECQLSEHSAASLLSKHEVSPIDEIGAYQVKQLHSKLDTMKMQASDVRTNYQLVFKSLEYLNSQYEKAQQDLNNAYTFYKQLLDERRLELQRDLNTIFQSKQLATTQLMHKFDELSLNIDNVVQFGERLLKSSSTHEILLFKKHIESKIYAHMASLPEQLAYSSQILSQSYDIEFQTNFQAFPSAVHNTLGHLRYSLDPSALLQSPILDPIGGKQASQSYKPKPIGPPSTFQNASTAIQLNFSSSKLNEMLMDNMSAFQSGGDSIGAFDAWSNSADASSSAPVLSGSGDHARDTEHDLNASTRLLPMHNPMLPARSQIRRQKMIYNCKFGEFGINDGQFTEPSGVAINGLNGIIVADTNSHRIQIFDREGRFKFKFGECGKREGQLLYPNRVSVVKQTGDIIVTERSPTHQIQIYNQYGTFVRKFGANILQHPRGVCVDNKGRIIVVECKVMRVIIFDQLGNVIHKFSCSKYLEFPNGVCVNDKQEIFISDNRAHCIKVFNYEGEFLRQIGGEGITNYPIGVGINSDGEVLVADNHNNFNLTVFTQDGQLINALESKVKHAQCFDVGLMDDGSIVLASKDYRIYVYKYNNQNNQPLAF